MGITCQAGLFYLSISFSSVPVLLGQGSHPFPWQRSWQEHGRELLVPSSSTITAHWGEDELCPSTFIPHSPRPTSVSLCRESPLSFGTAAGARINTMSRGTGWPCSQIPLFCSQIPSSWAADSIPPLTTHKKMRFH